MTCDDKARISCRCVEAAALRAAISPVVGSMLMVRFVMVLVGARADAGEVSLTKLAVLAVKLGDLPSAPPSANIYLFNSDIIIYASLTIVCFFDFIVYM